MAPTTSTDTTSAAASPAMLDSLLSRRHTLESWRSQAPEVDRLLAEVDAAIARYENGSLGVCQVCHGHMDAEQVIQNPLVTVCLDCMSTDERRQLEYDLHLAAEVQECLVPSSPPTPGGWDLATLRRPLGPVGGDWCDLLAYRGGVLAVVGDVSGKGVSGALLAAQIQALFRAEAAHERDLVDMLCQVNRLFCYASPDRRFATLVAVHLCPSGRLRAVVAGHCPPLLRRGDRVERLATGGPPIGIICSAAYVPTEAAVEPGDALLIVTDGISEAATPDGLELGIEPLSELLSGCNAGSAAQLADACLALAASHRSGAPAQDDITVLAAVRRAS